MLKNISMRAANKLVDAVKKPTEAYLFSAAEIGDLPALKFVLQVLDPNAVRQDGVTPLIVAALNGRTNAVRMLLDAGADPNQRSTEGWFAYNFARGAGHSETLALLLEAHGGSPPMYDHRSQVMKHFDIKRLDVYREAYGESVLQDKPFYNIGAGTTYHPAWLNVDHMSAYYAGDLYNNIDVDWDIAAMGSLAVPDDAAIAVYSSHTVEHIMDAHAEHMFKEAYRILKPGGFLRVTTPDIDIYYNAYADGDETFTLYKDMRKAGFPFEICLLNEFATQLREDKSRWDERAREVQEAFHTKAYNEALDHFTRQIDFSIQQERVGMHVNWWNAEKLMRMIRKAGFQVVYRSGYNQSRCPAMRDLPAFDTTDIATSVYVEARK